MRYIAKLINRSTIYAQLFFTVAVGIVLLLVAVVFASTWVSDQQVRKVLIEQGMQATSNLSENVSLALIYDSLKNAEAAIKSALAFPGVSRVEIYKTDGSIFYGSDEKSMINGLHDRFLNRAVNASDNPYIVNEDKTSWYFFEPVVIRTHDQSLQEELFSSQSTDKEKLIGYVFVVSSKESLKAIGKGILFSNFVIVFVIGLSLLFALRKVIKKLTQPLYSISEIMKKAEQGEYASHVDVGGPEEFHHIANAYNRMIEALAERDEVLRKQNIHLEKQAVHDHLTGLMNRIGFEQSLKLAIEECETLEVSHVLCYMDLDKFKIVNDSGGHNAGDELLKNVCDIFKHHIRKNYDVLARVGGDEFSLILKNCSLEKAKNIGENICEDIKNYRLNWDDKVFSVGVSIGVVQLDVNSGTIHDVISKADSACYAAKEKGRGQVFVIENDGQVSVKGEMQIADHIVGHLENDKLSLLCHKIQPLHTDDRTQNYFEIQPQMMDEDDEPVVQSKFISSAERYGLMSRIDRWVIENTLKILSENALFTETLDLCAINISASSLNDELFVDYIKQQLSRFKIDAHVICFQVTEMVAINNIGRVENFVADVHALGCQVALADFVGNSSSFSHIKKMDVDYLKIHGDFFKGFVQDPVNYAMAKFINEIAHILKIKTIAEDVDDDDILTELSELGVDYVQGDAIAKTVLIEDLVEHERVV